VTGKSINVFLVILKINAYKHKKTSAEALAIYVILVTSAGFEPANAALRGLRLKPLVDEAKTLSLTMIKVFEFNIK
jgi:hypothetical protein